MSFSRVLFGIGGRITRKQFWLGHLAIIVFFMACIMGLAAVGGTMGVFGSSVPAGPDQMPSMPTDPVGIAILAAIALAYIVMTCSSIAMSIKRLHDRGKSGWWLLLMYLLSIVIIGSIWWLVELGFLEGTHGDNQHGPDPLAGTRQATAPQAF